MIYRPSSLIPVSSSSFTGNESRYLLDCLSHNWITQGRYVQQFEEKFAEWSGRKHAIACSSGTAALHLSLLASGIDTETTVIVPAMTYIATANAAKYDDRIVKFVDVDPVSWCLPKSFFIDPEMEKRNLLILGVDLYDSLYIPPFNNGIRVAIDSSESGFSCGGIFATVSFYGSKLITTGEGGMVLTDDVDIAQQVRLYRGQGATIPGDYCHSVIGYNYRMTDLQAAVGLAQLERIDEFIAYRRIVIDHYRSNLHDDDRFTLQGGICANGWMFALLLPPHYSHEDRERVRVRLRDKMIETRPFFRPLPSLPPYYEDDYEERYPVSCELYRRGICLPTHVNLSVDDVDYVCEMLKEAVSNE